MKTILVTGAGGAAAANFVRSIRMDEARPWRVVGVDARPEHLHATPGLDARHLVPRSDHPGYLAAIQHVCETLDVDLIHPQPDPEVLVLAAARDHLPAATLLPSASVVELCHDKLRCAERLHAAGVSVPASHPMPADRSRVTEIIRELTNASAGSQVWIRAIRGAGSRGALPVSTADHALAWVQWWHDMRGLDAADFMLAEYLPGDEYAFQSIWFEGELVTSAARRRVEYLFGNLTPSGQTSTPALAESVADASVNDTAIRAIRAVAEAPHGVFCVDLKCDAAGDPCVTEVNAGRFFTTSDFFAAAGANMPVRYAELALGLPPSQPDLPPIDAVVPGLSWVRGIDVPATLVRGGAWNVDPLPAPANK